MAERVRRAVAAAGYAALIASIAAPIATARPLAAQSTGDASAGTGADADALRRPARIDIRDLPLAEALTRLQAASGVRLAYSRESLPEGRMVDCPCRDATVGAALARLLAGTGLRVLPRAGQLLITPVPDRAIPEAPPTPPAPPAPGAIAGRVLEVEGGAGIAGARVEVTPAGRAAFSGSGGAFRVEGLAPGSYALRVSAVGYEPGEAAPVSVRSGERTALDIALATAPLGLAALVVTPGAFGVRGDAETSLVPQTLGRNEMEVLPQIGEDAFRILERLPGVATGDISAKLQVRGGHADELLISLDGAELFEPYHMKDLDSVLGIVDVESLGSMTLYAGGLPARFGDRLTGALAMRTRRGVPEGPRHSLGLTASNVTARSRGTFGSGRGDWLLSARRGFLDLLLSLAQAEEDGEDLSPQYFDVLAAGNVWVADRHRVGVRVLHAGDDLDIVEFTNPQDRGELHSDWRNTNVWGSWDWLRSPAVEARSVVAFSALRRRRTGEVVDAGNAEAADLIDVDDEADVSFLTLRQDWEIQPGPRALFGFGGQLRLSDAQFDYRSLRGREFDRGDGTRGLAIDTLAARLDRAATESSLYASLRVRPRESLTVELGARGDRRSHTGDADVSPRLHAAFAPTPTLTVRAGWGIYRQSHRIDELSVADGETAYYPAERASQWAAGVELSRGPVDVRVEAYRRRISDPRPRYLNVVRDIVPFPEASNDRVRLLPERGRADGLEGTLRTAFGSQSDLTVGYVLARAEDRVEGDWVPRTFDQRHTATARWHRRAEPWAFSAGWQIHSGWPSTPLEFTVDTIGEGPQGADLIIEARPGPLHAGRLPAYHRLDFRVTRSFAVGGGTLRAFLDLFNVYGRENLRSLEYRLELPEGTVVSRPGETMLPFLPSFGIVWDF